MPKRKISRDDIMPVVDALLPIIEPVCEKITVAGSIRRQAEEVGDIELVVIPKTTTVTLQSLLFDPEEKPVCLLEGHIDRLCFSEGFGSPRLNKRGHKIAWHKSDATSRYIALNYYYPHLHDPVPVDIFIIREDRRLYWGWYLVLRTGPGNANKVLVTEKRKGGLKPAHVEFRDGQCFVNGEPYPLPNEQAVFDLFSIDYIQPQDRSVLTYKQAIRE